MARLELDVVGCDDRGGAAIDAGSEFALGVSRFIDHHPLKPLREWDGKDFGTYDSGD